MQATPSARPTLTDGPRTASGRDGEIREQRSTRDSRGELEALLILAVVVSLPMLILAIATTILEGVSWPLALAAVLVAIVAGLIQWSDWQIRRERSRLRRRDAPEIE